MAAPTTSACLDDEAVVALVEGRADPAALAAATAHAANCAECRSLLSTLAKTDSPALAATAPHPAPAAPGVLDVGTRVDRYLVTKLLGQGGMGVVYAAYDPELERKVAIKLLRPEAGGDVATRARLAARMQREAQAMAQLAHPNVVAVYDVGTFAKQIFIAMEFVAGDNLAGWLKAAPRTPRAILDTYIAAGRGLAAAHAAGLVHRDFKPENAIVGGKDGRVRVVDFGLAHDLGGRGPAAMATPLPTAVARAVSASSPAVEVSLTRTGMIVGTPYYMAPEQFRGEPADARSDQFAFCTALYGALFDERPFAGESFETLAGNILSLPARVPSPDKAALVARDIRDAIMRGLAGEREDRFASMDELLARLAPPPPPARGKLRWALAGGAIAAAVGVVVYATRGRAVAPVVEERACAQQRGGYGEVWNATVQGAIATALGHAAPGLAADTQPRVVAALDAYTARWMQTLTTACTGDATAARNHAATLACLGARQHGVAEATHLLAQPNADYAAAAQDIARALDAPEPCAVAEDPPGADLAGARHARTIRDRLAEVEVDLAAGDVARAHDAIQPLLEDAKQLDPTLHAEVVAASGAVLSAAHTGMRAPDAFGATRAPVDEATRELATRAPQPDDDPAARAVAARVAVARIAHFARLARANEAQWSRGEAMTAIDDAAAAGAITAGEAAALRARARADLARLELATGDVAAAEIDVAAARTDATADPLALARLARLHARVVAVAHPEAARAALAEARALLAAQLGADHPEVAATLVDEARLVASNAANASNAERGRLLDDAAAMLQRAFGAAIHWRADVLAERSAVALAAGDRAKAAALVDEAIAIDDVREIAPSQLHAARRCEVALAAGDYAAAYLGGTQLWTKSPSPPPLGPPGFHVDTDPDLVTHTRARELCVARAALEAAVLPPADHLPPPKILLQTAAAMAGSARYTLEPFAAFAEPRLVVYNAWEELAIAGEAKLALADYPAAIAALTEALGLVANEPDPARARVEHALGRALVDAKQDPTRGRALVVAAFPRLPPADPARSRAAAWMTAHGLSAR